MLSRKWRIDRQTKVRAGAFEIRRHRIGAAQDEFARAGRPGKPDARLVVCQPVVVVVKSPAIIVRATPLARDILLTSREIKIRLAIFHFDPGRVQFIAQSQIQCQIRRDAPVILKESAEDIRALPPGAAVNAAADIVRQAEKESASAMPAPGTPGVAAVAVASGLGPAV